MARSSLIPGFRFHPTDVELVMFYLKRKLSGKKITVKAVAEVNIYDFSPWDLPDKSVLKSGDLEWYFFCPKSKKYSSGRRYKRSTKAGFWKATGKDRQVSYNGRSVATIKTLVFHIGHAGKGQRTDWVMHEYKMEDDHLANAGINQDMYVLCKVFEKSGAGPKNGAHYGAPFNEEEWGEDLASGIDSNVVIGLVGSSDTMDDQQKGLTTMNMTEPGSSIVTSSSNRLTNKMNGKQKDPAAINMAEPGLSTVTFSADQSTTTFNQEERGADLAGCINSQMVAGLVAASNITDNEQRGLATMNMTEPGSSIVTSSNRFTNKLNDKQKGPAAINMAEPGSSTITFSADLPTTTFNEEEWGADLASCINSQMVAGLVATSNTTNREQRGLATMNLAEPDQPTTTFNEEQRGADLAGCINSHQMAAGLVAASNTTNNEQRGLATMNLAEQGSSFFTCSANQPTNTLSDEQKCPAATKVTEPSSSVITFSADQHTNTLNDKLKGPAATNMAEPQTEHVQLPADDAVLSFNDDEVMFFEDLDVIMGSEDAEAANVEKVKSMAPTKADGTFDGLVNLIDLDDLNEIDFKTSMDAYTLDNLLSLDDLDVHLGEFYVD